MDLNIEFLEFNKDNLNSLERPKRIWLNFWGKADLLKEDYANILNIFGKFDTSEIIMMNLRKSLKKQLKELFSDYSRVKVLDR